MTARFAAAVSLLFAPVLLAQDAAQPAASSAPSAENRAVMTGEQIVQILDETVDWYRTLGVQQQSATQPSDLLILYANRQTADKVVNLAFEIARANAELLSSQAEVAENTAGGAAASAQQLIKVQKELTARRQRLQDEIAVVERQIAAAPKPKKAEFQPRLAELQSELDLVNARRNLLDTMSQFVYQTDANGSGASALKEHIDAIAASIPAANQTSTAASGNGNGANNSVSNASANAAASPLINNTDDSGPRRLGIWDLAANVWRLSAKIRTIDAVDQRTATLQDTFVQIRTPPLERIKALSARGDSLAEQADQANPAGLREVRNQFDTLAWLFKQTSSILVPLSKAGVLLDQYRHNLSNWRDATKNQYADALKALAVRAAMLLALLALVFVAAEIWRRAVFRYVQEARRRYQLLLVRKIVLWSLIVAIIGFTFATELSSMVTFAGLITAGLAVAMQSVLVSIVGYFFLIGKYGIRVGDRVQIGTVTGEVIDLGLVRLHLMELDANASFVPTGRVVALPNSVAFQTAAGIFKQIPGVNLAWRTVTFALPAGSDHTALKEELLKAADNVIKDYSEEFSRQTREIQRTSSANASTETEAHPQVQLRFSITGVEAVVRYPVQLARAAEIDERISRELLNVVERAAGSAKARLTAPAK